MHSPWPPSPHHPINTMLPCLVILFPGYQIGQPVATLTYSMRAKHVFVIIQPTQCFPASFHPVSRLAHWAACGHPHPRHACQTRVCHHPINTMLPCLFLPCFQATRLGSPWPPSPTACVPNTCLSSSNQHNATLPFFTLFSGYQIGQPVATLTYDGFAEWAVTPAKTALKIPRPTPDMVALLTSGLTASIGEWEKGEDGQGAMS